MSSPILNGSPSKIRIPERRFWKILGAEGGGLVQLPAVFDGDRTVLQTGGDALLCPEQFHHLLRHLFSSGAACYLGMAK